MKDKNLSLIDEALQLQALGEVVKAAQLYRSIIGLQPGNLTAWVGLAQCLMEQHKLPDALVAWTAAAEIAPDSGAIKHMVDALSGRTTPQAPTDYLKWVFDGAAAEFDARLKALDYSGPQMAFSIFQKLNPDSLKPYCILDLGCGTGLNGEHFAKYAKNLDGVDVSEQMLTEARKKGFYSNIYKAEIHNFLTECRARYDLILATDVLIYIGKIEELLTLAFKALKNNGYFIFTIEAGEGDDLKLMPTGRYRHSDNYVRRAGKTVGFQLELASQNDIRKEANLPVSGICYAFKKATNLQKT